MPRPLMEQASSYCSCSLSVRYIIITQFSVLHHRTLILNRLLTFLTALSTLVLKPSFSQSLSFIGTYPLFGLISQNFTTRRSGNHCWRNIGKCGRSSQLSWLSVAHYNIVLLTYYSSSWWSSSRPAAINYSQHD